MPPPPPTRAPLNIDDVAIDFSAVKSASAASVPGGSAGSAGGASTAAAVIPGLLDLLQQSDGQPGHADGRARVSDVRAFDPALQGVAQRQFHVAGAASSRRKKVFGGTPFMPPTAEVAEAGASPAADARLEATTPSARGEGDACVPTGSLTAVPEGGNAESTTSAAQDALDFLISAQQQQQSSTADLTHRREAYAQELRAFCQRGRASSGPSRAAAGETVASFPSTSGSHTNSLHLQLFADGVPDIEPWDRWTSAMPRYGEPRHLVVNPATATARQIHEAQLDLLHHPVVPDTHFTRHYEYRDVEQPILPKEFKTKDELRAERRERLKEKQAKKQQERAAATSAAGTLEEAPGGNGSLVLSSSSSSMASRLLHDRLSTKSLALNLFASSVLNPLAADSRVLQQYELRDLEHQRRNHARHVAALPDQIVKRTRDQQRYATTNPILRAYRVYPIYAAAHLGKVRHYANDNLLRGFVLYVGDCDALIVLSGGEKAMRHLDHWILQKMEWVHPDTRATRLMTLPLMDAACFSFHLPKAKGARVFKQGKLVEGTSAVTVDGAADSTTEPVFINMVPTVEEGESFLRQLPAPSSPWADLTAIWRTAFLQDGLQDSVA